MVKGLGLGIAVPYLLSLLDSATEDALEEARESLEGLTETWDIAGVLR
jgi:hypothetical protein